MNLEFHKIRSSKEWSPTLSVLTDSLNRKWDFPLVIRTCLLITTAPTSLNVSMPWHLLCQKIYFIIVNSTSPRYLRHWKKSYEYPITQFLIKPLSPSAFFSSLLSPKFPQEEPINLCSKHSRAFLAKSLQLFKEASSQCLRTTWSGLLHQ